MRRRTSITLAACIAATSALSLMSTVAAHADPQARGTDVVGVGSDTLQYGIDFQAEGDYNSTTGFNEGSKTFRVYDYDATGNANGGLTAGITYVPRGGSTTVLTRPDGSGNGIAALLNDTTGVQVNFARASRLPNSTEETTATTGASSVEGGLHVYKVATDGLQVGTTTGSVAPAAISVADLVGIYQCTITKFNQISGNSGGSGDTIKPILPQTGSGTYGTFNADLVAANGGTAINYGSCVTQGVQESDPTVLFTGATATAAGTPNNDAIVPFSAGRIKLLNTGYLGPLYKSAVKDLAGTGTYNDDRNLYIVARQSDVTSTTPFDPNGTQNFVNTLFGTANSAFNAKSNNALYVSAGLVRSFKDCGLNPTSC